MSLDLTFLCFFFFHHCFSSAPQNFQLCRASFRFKLLSRTWIVQCRPYGHPDNCLSDHNQTRNTFGPVSNPVPANCLERRWPTLRGRSVIKIDEAIWTRLGKHPAQTTVGICPLVLSHHAETMWENRQYSIAYGYNITAENILPPSPINLLPLLKINKIKEARFWWWWKQLFSFNSSKRLSPLPGTDQWDYLKGPRGTWSEER